MIYSKYECKNKKSFYEFENDYESVVVKFTSGSGKQEIIEQKSFENDEEADEYYSEVINKFTTDDLFTGEKLKELFNEYEPDDEYEDFICLDLSSIGLINDNGSQDPDIANIKDIKTEMGTISDGSNLLRFLQWAVMFNTLEKGIIASMNTSEYRNFSKNKKNWIVTAGEHGQLTGVIAQIENNELIKPVNIDDYYIEKDTDLYFNLQLLFLNRQTSYPVELLSDILKNDERFKKHLKYLEELNVDEIIDEIKEEFIAYYEEEEYFDLIHFEWYAGNHNERNACAYPYKK